MQAFGKFSLSRNILILSVAFLSLAGLFVVFDPSQIGRYIIMNNALFFRQLLYILLGLFVVSISQDSGSVWYHNRTLVRNLFVLGLCTLVLVLLVGSRINGARSWFDLGLFSLQPADGVKIVFMLFLAHFYERRHILIKQPSVLAVPLGALTVVSVLLLMQPDFGTMIVFLAIWFGTTFAAGLWWKHTAVLLCSSISLVVIAWLFVFAPYQKDRILTFVHPERDPFGAGYNVIQSKIAIGSSGILGAGVGGGTQGRFGFLPEHNTDFVYASFTEEWGMIGGILVIVAIATIVIVLLWSAASLQRSSDSLYLVGYASMLAVHSIIHIGMNMGMLPVTGLPMPFMSFGGSHILTEYIGLAIALSIITHSRPKVSLVQSE
jgi:rod shape determining protein RodA